MSLTWEEKYARVQVLIGWERGFVDNGVVLPRWVDAERLWWVRDGSAGKEVRVEDIAGELLTTITYQELCRAVSKELEREVDPAHAVLQGLDVECDPCAVTFTFADRTWRYDARTGVLDTLAGEPRDHFDVSPDGTLAVFGRDHELWLHDLATGEERRLTSDGSPETSYGTPCAARRNRPLLWNRPEGAWSPDSRRYLTIQSDERHVPELPLVHYIVGSGERPVVLGNRTSLPADERPSEFHVLILDVRTGQQVRADHPPLPLVRMNDTVVSAGLSWWSADSTTAWFVHLERGEKAAHVVSMDAGSGATRVVMTETSEVPLELSVNVYTPALVHPLPDTDELVWFSERTGRGHLYLIDLATGECKNPITSGEWQVRDLLGVDPVRREVRLSAGGLDPSDPYLRRPCLAPLDGGALTVLSDEPGDHQVWRPREFGLVGMQVFDGVDIDRVSGFAPDGGHFVETVGAIGSLPVTVLKDRTGVTVRVVETAVATGLPDWFRWPEPFTVKAADGVTDLYGVLFLPPQDLLAENDGRYPLIDLIYGGPQVFTTPKSAFVDPLQTGTLFEAATFAQLGGFSMVLDGRGTAMRERAFRHASLGSVQTASDLADHEAAVRQLAQTYPIDLDRVGMTGFSGGGYATALAAFTRGDFFKVTVAGGGNYDQSLFWHGWGERYHGPWDREHYAQQAAHTYATGLEGRLMLIHGLLDTGCHPAGLWQVVQALNDANKDVDLVILPQCGHALPGIAVRRRLDHFVRHLFDETPPRDVELQGPHDLLVKRFALQTVASS